MSTHNNPDSLDDILNSLTAGELRDRLERLDPHTPDSVGFFIPAFAVHQELCQGTISFQVNREVATGIIESLQDQLDVDAPGEFDDSWANDLDTTKGN